MAEFKILQDLVDRVATRVRRNDRLGSSHLVQLRDDLPLQLERFGDTLDT